MPLTQRVRENDTCHSCGKSGHWARQCPKKPGINNNAAATPDFVGADGRKYRRSLPCPCGVGSCKLFTSQTLKNPGRKFYRCPANDKSKCQFFKWADEVMSDEFINIPFCHCGADFCRVATESVGPNAGRMFFICPIKKGYGACDFKLWQDAEDLGASSVQVSESIGSSHSTLTCVDASPATSDVVEECDVRSGVDQIDTSSDGFYYQHSTPPSTSGPVKSRKVILKDLVGEDEDFDEPSRKHCKRSRCGELKGDDTSLVSLFACLHLGATDSRNTLTKERPHQSPPESMEEIHPRQTELSKQIVVEVSASGSFASSPADSFVAPTHLVATRDWMLTSISQNSDLILHGWWGRLAFPPPRFLVLSSQEHLTVPVFPRETISITQDEEAQDDASPTSLLPTEINIWPVLSVDQDVQLIGSVEKKSYRRSSHEGGQSSIMRCSVSKVFLQAADRLQNDLLTLLESMDITDHKAMIQEADATFTALDCLGVDRQQFSEHVEAFISSASSMAEVECSISSDEYPEALRNQWISEKFKLDELSCAHVEATNAYALAKQRLLNLNEEASEVRARLSHIEAEIFHCEVENSALVCSLEHISEERKKSEENLSITSNELEIAQELGKQREMKRNAAKEAYEMAKALLRESDYLCITP